MKHAFLIMAYDDVDLLNIILSLLDSQGNNFFIHLDKDGLINEQDIKLDDIKKSKVFFTKRYRCKWGTIGIAQATRELIIEANRNGNYDYYHLMSGRDMPIKSISKLDCFLEKNLYNNKTKKNKTNYINFINNPSREYIERYTHYNPFIESYRSKNIIVRIFNKTYKLLSHIIQRALHVNRLKDDIKYLAVGSCWWTISNEFFVDLVKEIDWGLKLYSKYSFASDESIVQTIFRKVGNENTLFVAKDNYCDNIREIIFNEHNVISPYTFCEKDYKMLCDSKNYFARKFSTAKDRKIIELIKEKVIDEN